MLTVRNLPRQERFCKKWTMIVDIPGPSEPKLHINTFLKPLVDDILGLITTVKGWECGSGCIAGCGS